MILGIHGRKGEGKTFQCQLAFDRMGVEVVHMSAGELESPDAGDPARLIRLRYREAAELCKVRGRMAALMINDIDAGMGRVDQFTQYTVNTQLVAGTLMNIADNPTNVQLPGSYDDQPIQRIPIIVTGNDFATLYAPLIRDGRMEKFYWEPERSDRIGIVAGIFEHDHVKRSDIETLVDTFPNQSIDFYSALHSRLYDEQVRQFIHEVGFERVSRRIVNSAERPPEFRPPDFTLSHLIELGHLMVREQQRIQELRLGREYNTPQAALSRSAFSENAPQQQQHSPQPPQYSQPPQPEPYRPPVPPRSDSGFSAASQASGNGHTYAANGQASRTDLSSEALKTLKDLLNQGCRVGIEYVNERRFRTNSWQGYAVVQGNESDAIATLDTCLNEHSNDYVRLVGIRPQDRHRISEVIVHRPYSKAR
ncbi:MAG: hypothetical protein Kow00121_57680 [Elainellaceae cyanobacterium]